MKICLISNLYKPWIIGGAEIYVETIAKELSRKHEVFVITSEPFSGPNSLTSKMEFQDGIKVYRFFPVNIYHTYYAKKTPNFIKPIWHLIDIWNPHSYLVIKKILKKENPDIVHTHNLGGLSPSILYAARSYEMPVVHTLHDCSFLCPRATLIHEMSSDICKDPITLCKLYRVLKKKTTNHADVIIGSSNFILDTFDDAGLFASSNQKILLPLGVDHQIKPQRKQKDTFDILYVGHIAKHKGIDTLIKAFKKILDDTIRLHIAGTGPYIGVVEKMKDDPRIILHGFISGEQKEELFSLADICVVPSIFQEPFGLVIIESFFHGVPVVGSRIGGIPELIKEGYNGLLFEMGNIDALRCSLKQLIEHPEELKRLSKGAFCSAKEYTIQEHVKELETLYLSLIATRLKQSGTSIQSSSEVF